MSLIRFWLSVTPWTVAHQAPLSIESRQKFWNGLPFPSPGDLPDLGIEPRLPTLQADSLASEPPGKAIRFLGVPSKKPQTGGLKEEDVFSSKLKRLEVWGQSVGRVTALSTPTLVYEWPSFPWCLHKVFAHVSMH